MLAPPFAVFVGSWTSKNFSPTFRLMSFSWRTSSAAFARSSLVERMVRPASVFSISVAVSLKS
jgi:hypothetical protein